MRLFPRVNIGAGCMRRFVAATSNQPVVIWLH
jgi:hypothetical protein